VRCHQGAPPAARAHAGPLDQARRAQTSKNTVSCGPCMWMSMR
jgi:hypothetical protein